MSFKPIDAKRDEFRKYLERTGVLEAISKVFIKLIHCPDRPDNAIDFICANLGSTLHQNDQIENLQKDLEDSKDEIAQLKQIIENLKSDKKIGSAAVNEEITFGQQQETDDEYKIQNNTLSDDIVNLEKQMANTTIDDTSNISFLNKSLSSNEDIQEDNSPTVNENVQKIKDESKIDVTAAAAAVDKVTEPELSKKIEETAE